jgi:hypothetical protein
VTPPPTLAADCTPACSCPLCGEPDLPFPGDASQLALPLPPDPEPLAWPRRTRRLADIEAEAFGKVHL